MNLKSDRRWFLRSSAGVVGAPLVGGLGSLGALSCAAAAEPRLDAGGVRATSDIKGLVRLLWSTPREACVAAVIKELKAGLSYHDLLSALFLAAIEHGDPHQVAQVYSAHRVASEARAEERLLPLLWAVERVALGFEQEPARRQGKLKGPLPPAGGAVDALNVAMRTQDAEAAERAIVAIARRRGAQQAWQHLWAASARRTAGTLGHHPIMAANGRRTLEALAWQRAEPLLRYLAGSYSQHDSDRTYEPNLERAAKVTGELPPAWARSESERDATLELYGVLRTGHTNEGCDLICKQLTRSVPAGTVWDAIHLTASDLVYRYKTGGMRIGSALIHAVTSTNALRYAFNATDDDRVRMLLVLQAASALGEVFHADATKDGELREMNLLELGEGDGLRAARRTHRTDGRATVGEVFALLPAKAEGYVQQRDEERAGSDAACRLAFALLQSGEQVRPFMQTARTLLCTKASLDPHDMKYPVAIFEDAGMASAEWRPYLLASSVHALHGTASADAGTLVRARAALG